MATDARISQEAIEVLIAGVPAARISQEAIEVLVSQTAYMFISQVAIEVIVQRSVVPVGQIGPYRLVFGIS